MTTIDILKQARELITDSNKWTTGAYARDVDDDTVPPRSSLAVCWCALGALKKVSEYETDCSNPAASALEEVLGTRNVHTTNDGPDGHAKVLAAYDVAIAKLEAAQ